MRKDDLRSRTIRLAYQRPELRPHLLPLLAGNRLRRADLETTLHEPTPQEEEMALRLMVESWVDGALNILKSYRLSDEEIGSALEESSGSVDAEDLNEAYAEEEGLDLQTIRTAGLADTVSAFGGTLLKGAWHMLTAPFHALWKLLTSSEYRKEIKTATIRAVKHEARSTRHMTRVAVRMFRGEEVKPQEIRAAAIQFADIFSKVLLAWIVGPHIAHLFSHGVVKALMSLLSPLDEIVGVLLDKPLRWMTQKLLGQAIGLLPSGFYTHF